jgi:TPR repeat protein
MNEMVAPDPRRPGFRSLDTDALSAARRAAAASGLTLEEWLSRIIIENARKSGVMPPSRFAAADAPRAAPPTPAPAALANAQEESIRLIARHLERAKQAADQQGLSLAEWLSRAILANGNAAASTAPTSGPAAAPSAPAAADGPAAPASASPAGAPRVVSAGPPKRGPNRFAAPPARRAAATGAIPRARAATDDTFDALESRRRQLAAGVGPDEPSVRDVIMRASATTTPMDLAKHRAVADEQRETGTRRPVVIALWATLGVLALAAAALWSAPYWMPKVRSASALSTDTVMRVDIAGLPTAEIPGDRPGPSEPGAEPKTEPAKPEAPAPQPGHEPPKAEPPKPGPRSEGPRGEPPAAEPKAAEPKTAEAKPPATNPPAAEPPKAEAKPPAAGGPGALPQQEANAGKSDTEGELSKVEAKDMPKPPEQHAEWYRRAAEADNYVAQYILGEMHVKGAGVAKDFGQAARWFRRSADRGNLARSQYALGLLYARGLGVAKSDVEALLWFQKAADQGHLAAITQVGIFLLEGRGTRRDPERARQFLERAAEGEELNAQYTLGRMYERGDGVKKDMVEAMKWYILAAEQGHKQAIDKVEDLSASMPRELQDRATERVNEHYRRFRRKS